MVRFLTGKATRELHNIDLIKKLVPDYEVGCKRICPSDTYLGSFNRDNVTLVTEGIDCFEEDGIKTADGRKYKVDAVVYATGYLPAESWHTTNIFGVTPSENGSKLNLKDEWKDTPSAYKGITYPGYPNLFFMLGPGTASAHNSVIFTLECQAAYIVDAVRYSVLNNIRSVEVKKRALDDYQRMVQEYMKNKAYISPRCTSWYRNKKGVNYTIWPSHFTHYWWITRTFDANQYICSFN